VPIVSVETHLDTELQAVWTLICDMEAYPRFMEPVKEVQILSKTESFYVSRWVVELKGSLLCWIQEEHHDPRTFEIHYAQREGDLERFQGAWRLKPAPDGGTLASLEVDFEIGIPMLRDMLNPVAERALRENSLRMLSSLDACRQSNPIAEAR
jgi:ribosome-associated toxin RatA of RatAB toxin-antitoxin module